MPSVAAGTPQRAASSSTRTAAVVSLVPLKNSLCNLPGSLSSSLVVSNTVSHLLTHLLLLYLFLPPLHLRLRPLPPHQPAQNVLVELVFKPPQPPSADGK